MPNDYLSQFKEHIYSSSYSTGYYRYKKSMDTHEEVSFHLMNYKSIWFALIILPDLIYD